ncbi:hypothetical protein HZS_7245 [Henneguya salminicola]|nr:hypothetical protein HZS_7245 [Henneguya salminicola]
MDQFLCYLSGRTCPVRTVSDCHDIRQGNRFVCPSHILRPNLLDIGNILNFIKGKIKKNINFEPFQTYFNKTGVQKISS